MHHMGLCLQVAAFFLCNMIASISCQLRFYSFIKPSEVHHYSLHFHMYTHIQDVRSKLCWHTCVGGLCRNLMITSLLHLPSANPVRNGSWCIYTYTGQHTDIVLLALLTHIYLDVFPPYSNYISCCITYHVHIQSLLWLICTLYPLRLYSGLSLHAIVMWKIG